MRSSAVVVLALAGVMMGNGGAAQGLLRPGDAATVATGKAVYEEYCASCHGAELEGQANWRTARSPEGRALAPPQDETGHSWHHPDAQLLEIVRKGVAAIVGRGYESDMIGYEEILTEAQIIAVLSYIKSTWPEEIRAQHDAVNASQ